MQPDTQQEPIKEYNKITYGKGEVTNKMNNKKLERGDKRKR